MAASICHGGVGRDSTCSRSHGIRVLANYRRGNVLDNNRTTDVLNSKQQNLINIMRFSSGAAGSRARVARWSELPRDIFIPIKNNKRNPGLVHLEDDISRRSTVSVEISSRTPPVGESEQTRICRDDKRKDEEERDEFLSCRFGFCAGMTVEVLHFGCLSFRRYVQRASDRIPIEVFLGDQFKRETVGWGCYFFDGTSKRAVRI